MREQRDKISKDIMNLNPREIVIYFESRGRDKYCQKPSAGKRCVNPTAEFVLNQK